MEITNKCGLGDKLDCQPTTKSVTFNHWVKGCPMCNKVPWLKKERKNVDHITYAPIDKPFDYRGAQEVSNPTKSLVIANGTTCVWRTILL
jgi:hypothetical protein